MKLRKLLIIFSLFLVLTCYISAINAVSYDNIDNNRVNLDESQKTTSITNKEITSESNTNTISSTQDKSVLKETSDEEDIYPKSRQLTPYEQFQDDLDNWRSNIVLTGSFTIKEEFMIRHNVIIDGAGYTIDAQKNPEFLKHMVL